MVTFEGRAASLDELIKVEVRKEPAAAGREEEVGRQAHLLGDVHHVPHGAVGDDAADRRDAVRAVEPLDEPPDGGRARPARGLAERPDVPRGFKSPAKMFSGRATAMAFSGL